MDDLPQPLGPFEVAEPMLAQIEKRHALRQLVDGEGSGRVRHENLPAVSGFHHPGCSRRVSPR